MDVYDAPHDAPLDMGMYVTKGCMVASGLVGSCPRQRVDRLAASVAASIGSWRAGTGAGRVRKGPGSRIAWPRQLQYRYRREVTDTSIP